MIYKVTVKRETWSGIVCDEHTFTPTSSTAEFYTHRVNGDVVKIMRKASALDLYDRLLKRQ